MPLKVVMALSMFLATTVPGCEDCRDSLPVSPSSISASNPAENFVSPGLIHGVELTTIRGWWANLYPWEFLPKSSPVHPIPELFTPYQKQSVAQIQYQERILNAYGSALDILQLDPSAGDFTHWQSAYLPYTRRPFFILYEHINNRNYIPPKDGPKDMDNLVNRRAFMRDIDFIFSNIVRLSQSRYVTVNGRAVIYMWSSGQMMGDFASLLDEARQKYPVFFIGSGEDISDTERISAFDSLMEYSLAGFGGALGDYQMMLFDYHSHFTALRNVLDTIQHQTGKKIYLFATFQAAYDDTLTGRTSTFAVYPKTRDEMIEHARLVQLDITRWKIFDGGPLVIFSELPEGASVIPSILKPETAGRYLGYGTGRIEIAAKYFGRR